MVKRKNPMMLIVKIENEMESSTPKQFISNGKEILL
jgi:hypothetical protein